MKDGFHETGKVIASVTPASAMYEVTTGHTLGGTGDRINIAPQAQRLNREVIGKKMENELVRDLKIEPLTK